MEKNDLVMAVIYFMGSQTWGNESSWFRFGFIYFVKLRVQFLRLGFKS